ncbi:unnamed protein product [Phyllotreta striolata]|uniref:Tetratricopeptide repeat protein 19 homolog, mitochondrial n=1 Tax=Phyllotreta striolata TaxID=444603 RepID=A0A9N9XJS6_PHYSR|nr:unnamed protein product [Phyllotreta striolata]
MQKFIRILFNAKTLNRLVVPTVHKNYVFLKQYNQKLPFTHTNVSQASLRFLKPNAKSILAISLLSWLGFAEEDKNKESELIMTLKRSVLCINREQYDKAEQMLHLALRIAQQQQNEQGALYCFDLMANLAFEQRDLDKAHKLFVHILQLLLSKGTPEDDIKVIHISLKLARIYQLGAELEQAEIGYAWCLEQIKNKKNQNKDTKILYGVINDWYAQFLLDKNDVKKALVHLKEAYSVCNELSRQDVDQTVLLLNDLGTTCFRANDMTNAENYLKQAVSIGKDMQDKAYLGVVHANLGLILLEKGLLDQAKKFCKEALYLGKKHENSESINQANYCFDQIKMNLNK